MLQSDFLPKERMQNKIEGSARLLKLENRGLPKSKPFKPETETQKMVSETKFKLQPEEKREAAKYMEDLLKKSDEEDKNPSAGDNQLNSNKNWIL